MKSGYIFSLYLSELSLSTDGMCARLFPWLSLFPGPEPPETHETRAIKTQRFHH